MRRAFIPLAVILSVPFGLMGSFLFAKLFGLENNIYLQTGVIMLIGLLAKTAILITEFAVERRRRGMGIIESAYSAAQARLRPILMTFFLWFRCSISRSSIFRRKSANLCRWKEMHSSRWRNSAVLKKEVLSVTMISNNH